MTLAHKYTYRRTLPHLQKDYRPVFITFATYKRWCLPESARGLVLDVCLKEAEHMYELHAAVVMPDHVHLILTPLRAQDGFNYSLPEIMKVIKGSSSHAVNAHLHHVGTVWQHESFDHVLRSNESLSEKIEYVIQNPVRAGLAERAHEYRWVYEGKVPVI